ncbi:MAG: DUF4954 family protein, partial [Planctomycetota bacterium]
MDEVRVIGGESPGHDFITPKYLPKGEDEYYLRNAQSPKPADYWRKLKPQEIEALQKNANTADNWAEVLVADPFDPQLISNCRFHGLVRIGKLEAGSLEADGLRVPIGLSDSRIVACDIGDNAGVHDVSYLAHYIIGDNVILMSVDEMLTTECAKFGNGIVKDGEDEDDRLWLEMINEAGGREIMPFDGIRVSDAALWTSNRDDSKLIERLGVITQNQFDSRRGLYGIVGDKTVVKSTRSVRDVKIGPCAVISGANKLENLTINSSGEEPTHIGEGVELVDGIVGYSCHVEYGVKALKFILGDNVDMELSARMLHTFLGDNSQVACCEVLNNLIYPAHGQHHNSSFLIATKIMGQSNIASAATIGSNHNSRAPDGEIHAGRGFWPGLCTSLKHNCRFASFILLAKGDYPAELNVPLPFSLLSNNDPAKRLQILPGYWWLYNMYALARNTWKFQARDKRKVKRQKIELDSLAPDTAEEMFAALDLLAKWIAQAQLRSEGQHPGAKSEQELISLGKELLEGAPEKVDALEVLAEGVEKSKRKVVIFKARPAYHAYRQMLHYYAVKNLLAYMKASDGATRESMCKALGGQRERVWVNLGGQLISGGDLEKIKTDIKSGKLDDWNAIHDAYDKLWEAYPLARQRHALASLLDLLGAKEHTDELWNAALDKGVEIQNYICEQT